MGALLESRSLEAQIADCCREIYSATDVELAMNKWTRLRELLTEKSAEETRLFLREAKLASLPH